MLFGNLMASSVDVRQQCSSTCVRTAACAAVGPPAILGMPLQVPFCAVSIAALKTFVLLLCMHLHKMLPDISRRYTGFSGRIQYYSAHAGHLGNHFTYLLNQCKLGKRSVRASWTALYRTTVELL